MKVLIEFIKDTSDSLFKKGDRKSVPVGTSRELITAGLAKEVKETPKKVRSSKK